MTERRKYFDIEIDDDVTKFYVGCDECEYPFTFTVEECVEEYCAMRDMELVRIIPDGSNNGRLRSGEFWCEQPVWTDAFGNIRNVQQAVTRMGSSMEEVASAMVRVQEQMREGLSGWLSGPDRWHCGDGE